MSVPLNLELPEPEWIGLLRAEVAAGKSISQIARETGIARPSVSMLLSNTYPAKSFDLVTRKHGARVVQLYRNQVLCPHLQRSIGADVCKAHASAPMSTSQHEKLRHWRACSACSLNPVAPVVKS